MTKREKETAAIFMLLLLWVTLWLYVPKFVKEKKIPVISEDLEDFFSKSPILISRQKKDEFIEYAEANKKDPLKPSIDFRRTRTQPVPGGIFERAPVRTEESKIELPALRVQGAVWGTDKPRAIINDEVVGRGDTISGAKILDINSDGIRFLYKGEEFLLPIPSIKKGEGNKI